MMLIIHKPDN